MYGIVLDESARLSKDVFFFAEETEATNELISATGAQALTMEDIEALKAEGLSGRDIIEAQVTSHASFELKNEYSKIKYRQRKESKCVPLPFLLPRETRRGD
jgi:tRNA (adenine-N(1)-)-methyltransferase non-catalytic subunit